MVIFNSYVKLPEGIVYMYIIYIFMNHGRFHSLSIILNTVIWQSYVGLLEDSTWI